MDANARGRGLGRLELLTYCLPTGQPIEDDYEMPTASTDRADAPLQAKGRDRRPR
jgi:hypothetical protein